jgi:hypothetical protein
LRLKIIKKCLNAPNALFKFARSVIDKLIQGKLATQFSRAKLKIGKNHLTFKNAKNVYLWFKKFLAVTICHALFVDISGVGSVGRTIRKPILVHLIH